MVVEGVTVDRENNLDLTLAVPVEENGESVALPRNYLPEGERLKVVPEGERSKGRPSGWRGILRPIPAAARGAVNGGATCPTTSCCSKRRTAWVRSR